MPSLNHTCIHCSQRPSNNAKSWFAEPFVARAGISQNIKNSSSCCNNTWTTTFSSERAYTQDWRSCLAAQIITFPSKWDENTSLLPGTKAGHYHLVSNILLETIKQFFCYRVMSYSFLETATLKETLLGWMMKRDLGQMEMCQCSSSLAGLVFTYSTMS